MRRVLWWLIGGSRGGRNRLRVVRTLHERPMNAHQLSKALDLDYKTTRHHLDVLQENGVLTTMGDDYGKTYFLTDRMESEMHLLDEVARKAGLDDGGRESEHRGRTGTEGGTGTEDGTGGQDGVGESE